MQENKILVKVPFPGFYCTVLDSLIDGEINQYYDWYAEENGKDIPEHEINYRAIFEDIAKKWCDVWGYSILDNISWDLRYEFDISFNFESLRSPKFYNFETDKVYAYCDFEKLKTLYDSTAGDYSDYTPTWRNWLYKRMQPCSGFIPHYSNDLDDWGDFKEWDFNQYGLFLEWLDSQYETEFIYDDLLETISNSVWENITISEAEND